MSNQEENNMNNEEENFEEYENLDNLENHNEQFEENENMEDDQGIYTFEIQINEDIYILILAKTDENKLLVRLGDKEGQNVIFENDFSFDDLKKINPLFNNIEEEDIAFQYIIENMNDADKEIKIVDQNQIKFIITIDEQGKKVKIPLNLIKMEGEENPEEENAEHQDKEIEEGMEYIQGLMNGGDKKEEVPPESKDANGKKAITSSLPVQIEGQQGQNKKMENASVKKEDKAQVDDINVLKDEMAKTIKALNDNFNNELLKQNENFKKMREEMEKANENKIKELTNALKNKDNELKDMKTQFANLSDKFNKFETTLKDKKDDGKELTKLNERISQIDGEIKNMNDKFNGEISKNNSKLRLEMNDLLGKLGDVKVPKKGQSEIGNKLEMANIMNNFKDIEERIGDIKNEIQNNKVNHDKESKLLDDRINKLNDQLKENNTILKNQKIEFAGKKEEKPQNIPKFDEVMNKIVKFENIANNLETKMNNLENGLKNTKNLKTKEKEETPNYDLQINNLENAIQDIINKLNSLDLDDIYNNISDIRQNENNTQDMINNIENSIKDIYTKLDRPETRNKDSYSNKDNSNNEMMMKRINNLENMIKSYENNFQKINEENRNNNNNRINTDKKISAISTQANELQNAIESINNKANILEKATKGLDNKISELQNNISQMSIQKENEPNKNEAYEKIRNQKRLIDNKPKAKNNYYNEDYLKDKKINNNIIDTNNGYQIMVNTSDLKQKPHYEMENVYNNSKQYLSNPNNYNYNNTYSTPSLNNIDSKIVQYDDIIFLKNRLREIHPKISNIIFNLVYRATEDGDKAADFHNKCDKIGPNITLIKTRKGYVFGGFTFKNWEHMKRDIDLSRPNLGSASRDSRAFGFNVNNQKIYENEKPNEFAIWCNRNFGPTFKNNMFQIFDSCLKKGGYCSVKEHSHFGGQNYDYEISGGEGRFKIAELEVYEVKFQ